MEMVIMRHPLLEPWTAAIRYTGHHRIITMIRSVERWEIAQIDPPTKQLCARPHNPQPALGVLGKPRAFEQDGIILHQQAPQLSFATLGAWEVKARVAPMRIHKQPPLENGLTHHNPTKNINTQIVNCALNT